VTAAVINIWKITYKLRRKSQHKIITAKVRGEKSMCEYCEIASLQKFTNNGPNEHKCHPSQFFL
jgi:hypothetical protein